MNNSGRRALDIALAAVAGGMYAKLLTAEDKQRIAQARSTTGFLTLLQRSGAWRDAALMLQSGEQSDASFAEAVDRCVYTVFARLYRFANDMSRQFLTFITLDAELEAIMKAIRRVASPPPEGAKEPEPLPRALRRPLEGVRLPYRVAVVHAATGPNPVRQSRSPPSESA